MKKNSPTEVGPTDSGQPNAARIDVINQVFALFKRNYHNQFFKAYGSETDVNTTKRLWLEALVRFDESTQLHAARRIIEHNEFLPSLATMIKACEASSDLGLPDAHSAYLEACRAPSPKAAHTWRHLAVYYAGRASDWYFLQSNSEHIAYPIFRQHYQEVCDRVRLGESLAPPELPKLSHDSQLPASKEKARAEFKKLRQLLDT